MNLAFYLKQGLAGTVDQAGAVRWLTKAADGGTPEAMSHLSRILRAGHDGVSQDQASANRWLQKAAELGHVESQAHVGHLMLQGVEGIDRDPEEAVRWLTKASSGGHAEAQYRLAMCYGTGEGVKQDPTVVESLLLKAARQGHPEAKKALDRARDRGILRPTIPQSKPLNMHVEDQQSTERKLNSVAFGEGAAEVEADEIRAQKSKETCEWAADKEQCLRLKAAGVIRF